MSLRKPFPTPHPHPRNMPTFHHSILSSLQRFLLFVANGYRAHWHSSQGSSCVRLQSLQPLSTKHSSPFSLPPARPRSKAKCWHSNLHRQAHANNVCICIMIFNWCHTENLKIRDTVSGKGTKIFKNKWKNRQDLIGNGIFLIDLRGINIYIVFLR